MESLAKKPEYSIVFLFVGEKKSVLKCALHRQVREQEPSTDSLPDSCPLPFSYVYVRGYRSA